MGRKITLEQAIYQGDRIAVFYCEAMSARGVCAHGGEARLIELIDAFGPLMRLDDLPARCTRCGRADGVDVRARPFKRDGAHNGAREIEGDGLPYGNAHMTWLHEANGRGRDCAYRDSIAAKGKADARELR